MTNGFVRKALYCGIGWLMSVAISAQPAEACTVCFGDPESSMAKGAVAGVFVLVGVVGFVLLGMAGTGLFWLHRGRCLARGQHIDNRGHRPETSVRDEAPHDE